MASSAVDSIIARVRRRHALAQALDGAGRGLALGAAVGVGLVITSKFVLLPESSWLIVGPMSAGALAGVLWGILRAWPARRAAIEVDARLGLKDRIASAWSLARESPSGPGAADPEFARLAMAHGESAAAAADPRRAVPIRLDRWWGIWPAGLAVGLAAFALAPRWEWRTPGPPPPPVATSPPAVIEAIEAARGVAPEGSAPRELAAIEDIERELLAGERSEEEGLAAISGELDAWADRLEREREDAQQRLERIRSAAEDAPDLSTPAVQRLAEALATGDDAALDGSLGEIDALSADERASAADDLERLAEAMERAEPTEPPGSLERGEPGEGASPPAGSDGRPAERELQERQDPSTQGPPESAGGDPATPPDAQPTPRESPPPPGEGTGDPTPAPEPPGPQGQGEMSAARDGARREGSEPPPSTPQSPREGGESEPGAGQRLSESIREAARQLRESGGDPERSPPRGAPPSRGSEPPSAPGATPGERPKDPASPPAGDEAPRDPGAGEPSPDQPPATEPGAEPSPEPEPGESPEQGTPRPEPTGEPSGAEPSSPPGAEPSQGITDQGSPEGPSPGEPGAPPSDAGPGPRPSAAPEGGTPTSPLRERLRELSDERRLGDRAARDARELRRQAQRLLNPGAGSSDPPGTHRLPPEGPAATGSEWVDARPRGDTPADLREQVIREWLGEGDPGAPSGPDVARRFAEAAAGAERAVEEQAVPARHAEFVRRVFRRYVERAATDRP